MKKRKIIKTFVRCYFYIGVDVIGIPLIEKHLEIYTFKERNILQRYSY